uniref:Nuclear condensin complex subunit 3 C-terminal domain-containing protein n=1 Tax=Clastoptera arizonana TaxID=38151 RepID=A0A1B6DYJ7_9HEMI
MSNVKKKVKGKLSGLTVNSAFYDSQYTSKHDSYIIGLKKLYKQIGIESFLPDFIKCLKVAFTYGESGNLVENTLNFAAKFSVSLGIDIDDEICPFLDGILQFLFEIHDSVDPTVRLRVCRFLNRLFESMGHDASVDEDVYEKIGSCMMDRLQDKVAKVRAEAVSALHRLQDPSNPSCRITTVFLYHMKCDPSYEVRCAIVQKIAVNKKTLPFILRRIHDIKDLVRKEAYKVLAKLTVKKLSIRQRQTILKSGLYDKFATVHKFITEKMLPEWLDDYDSNYIDFMQAINAESFTDVTILALKKLFKLQLVIPIASVGIKDNIIPQSMLTPERALYWRVLAEYVKENNNDEEDDTTRIDYELPDLTPFTQYMRQYFFSKNQTEEDNTPSEYVLVQLLHMTKLYDFSDEVGRLSLKDLCLHLFLSSRVGPNTTAVIGEIFSKILPDPNQRLLFTAEAISELREPLLTQNLTFVEKPENNSNEQNDPTDTTIKCLTLLTTVIEAEDIVEMNPTLHSLMENFVLVTIDNNEAKQNKDIQQLAVQALTIFCILDLQLAKEKFFMFCFNIANEIVCVTSLKAVFDLLFCHGLSELNVDEPTGNFLDNNLPNGVRQRPNLITLLVSLLDSKMAVMRNITLQGLCKLIYAKRISNPYLLSRLIILWFNTELEEDAELRQSLSVFFNLFATCCPHAPQMFLECFLYTIKVFLDQDYKNDIERVDVAEVANLMINLSRPSINKNNKKKNVHNLLAIEICIEILKRNEGLEIHHFIKCLLQLELNFQIASDIDIISKLIIDIKKNLGQFRDKTNIKLLNRLEIMLETRPRGLNNSVAPVENTLPESLVESNNSRQSSKVDTISECGEISGSNESFGSTTNVKTVNQILPSGTPESATEERVHETPESTNHPENSDEIVVSESSESENGMSKSRSPSASNQNIVVSETSDSDDDL